MWMDRQIVANGQSMKEILKATQAEAEHSRYMAKQSQDMAEDMRKDSVSMKAVRYPMKSAPLKGCTNKCRSPCLLCSFCQQHRLQ